MKHALVLFLAVASVLPLTTATACDPVYGKRMAGFKPVPLEGGGFQSIEEAVAFYNGPTEEGPEAPVVDISQSNDPKGKYDKIVTITKTRLPDDSLTAQQMQIAMKRSTDGWDVLTAGERWKCARGKNTAKWTIKSCP